MVVAARAFGGQPEEGGAERVHTVHDVGDAIFFLGDAAFLVLVVQTVEGGGEPLLLGRVRQEIAGELPRHKLIEGQVLVECLDDPVAIRPHGAEAIHLIAVRVGEAREVEPFAGHALAETRRRQQTIHDALVGIGGGVGEKGIQLFQRRRQAREIKGHAAQPRSAIRFGRGRELFLFQPREDESVNGGLSNQ